MDDELCKCVNNVGAALASWYKLTSIAEAPNMRSTCEVETGVGRGTGRRKILLVDVSRICSPSR